MIGGGPLRHLDAELAWLEKEGLLRHPSRVEPGANGGALVLCSNDYLGYASEALAGDESFQAAAALASGAGASRLVSGEHQAHGSAEDELARWVGMEAALLFSSGYAANVGVVSALAGRGDLIVSDALNHASIIDGCRLSGASVVVVPHADVSAVERALEAGRGAARRWVVTESYFSMDGDIPDLRRLREVSDAFDAGLIVDEAHALGVFGCRGAGLCAEAGVRPDVLVATLGKTLGLQGAFVAGSRVLRTYLWNRARTFVFSTGMSPAFAGLVVGRARRAAQDDAARRHLERVSDELRQGLRALFPDRVRGSRGPIIPLIVGSPTAALDLSKRLRERGVWVQAIRPPTVPRDTSRLRVAASARLSNEDVRRVLEAFASVSG